MIENPLICFNDIGLEAVVIRVLFDVAESNAIVDSPEFRPTTKHTLPSASECQDRNVILVGYSPTHPLTVSLSRAAKSILVLLADTTSFTPTTFENVTVLSTQGSAYYTVYDWLKQEGATGFPFNVEDFHDGYDYGLLTPLNAPGVAYQNSLTALLAYYMNDTADTDVLKTAALYASPLTLFNIEGLASNYTGDLVAQAEVLARLSGTFGVAYRVVKYGSVEGIIVTSDKHNFPALHYASFFTPSTLRYQNMGGNLYGFRTSLKNMGLTLYKSSGLF